MNVSFVERRHSQSSYLQFVEQRSIVMDNLFFSVFGRNRVYVISGNKRIHFLVNRFFLTFCFLSLLLNILSIGWNFHTADKNRHTMMRHPVVRLLISSTFTRTVLLKEKWKGTIWRMELVETKNFWLFFFFSLFPSFDRKGMLEFLKEREFLNC